jgi:hypothetical protein
MLKPTPKVKKPLKVRWRNWRAYRKESAQIRAELGQTNRALSSAKSKIKIGKSGPSTDYGLLPLDAKGMKYFSDRLAEGKREFSLFTTKKEELILKLEAIKIKYGY